MTPTIVHHEDSPSGRILLLLGREATGTFRLEIVLSGPGVATSHRSAPFRYGAGFLRALATVSRQAGNPLFEDVEVGGMLSRIAEVSRRLADRVAVELLVTDSGLPWC